MPSDSKEDHPPVTSSCATCAARDAFNGIARAVAHAAESHHASHAHSHLFHADHSEKKKRKKKKKGTSESGAETVHGNTTSSSSVGHAASSSVWSADSNEERQRIRDFWLGLDKGQRRLLVQKEKEAVLQKLRDQQKHACTCAVCGRKRTVIEEELEVLYDAYYDELEAYAYQQQQHQRMMKQAKESGGGGKGGNIGEDGDLRVLEAKHAAKGTLSAAEVQRLKRLDRVLQINPPLVPAAQPSVAPKTMIPPPPPTSASASRKPNANGTTPRGHAGDLRQSYFNFGAGLTAKSGILNIADDLLRNDGKKFLEMMERLAERRMRREELERTAHQTSAAAMPTGGVHHGHYASEDEYDDEEDYDDDYEDDEESQYEDDEEVEDPLTEEQRMEEGRRMFQVFAARLFEQRVLTAYREKVAAERQKQLILELEEEERLEQERERKKNKEKEKKKEKKKAAQKQKEEERLARERQAQEEKERLEAEAKARREAERKRHEEEQRRKAEEKRKKEEERWKKEEEKRKKREEEQQRLKREKEEREEAKRRAREEALAKAAEEHARQQKEKKVAEAEMLAVKDATKKSPMVEKLQEEHLDVAESVSSLSVSPLVAESTKSSTPVSPLRNIPGPILVSQHNGIDLSRAMPLASPNRRGSAPVRSSIEREFESPLLASAAQMGFQPPPTGSMRNIALPAPYFVPALPTIPDGRAMMMPNPQQQTTYPFMNVTQATAPMVMPTRPRILSQPDLHMSSSSPNPSSQMVSRFTAESMAIAPQQLHDQGSHTPVPNFLTASGLGQPSGSFSAGHGVFASAEPSLSSSAVRQTANVGSSSLLTPSLTSASDSTSLGSKALGGDVVSNDVGVDWDIPPRQRASTTIPKESTLLTPEALEKAFGADLSRKSSGIGSSNTSLLEPLTSQVTEKPYGQETSTRASALASLGFGKYDTAASSPSGNNLSFDASRAGPSAINARMFDSVSSPSALSSSAPSSSYWQVHGGSNVNAGANFSDWNAQQTFGMQPPKQPSPQQIRAQLMVDRQKLIRDHAQLAYQQMEALQVQQYGRRVNPYVTMVDLFRAVSQLFPSSRVDYREIVEACMSSGPKGNFELMRHPSQPDLILVKFEEDALPASSGGLTSPYGPPQHVVYRP